MGATTTSLDDRDGNFLEQCQDEKLDCIRRVLSFERDFVALSAA